MYIALGILLLEGAPASASAPLPGPADIDRVNPTKDMPDLRPMDIPPAPAQEETSVTPAPEGAKSIKLILKKVKIEGSTVYPEDTFSYLYASDLGHEVTLDKAWQIATAITQRYRADGYFLSRAYVPAQEIDDGTITIGVVEGYIGQVTIDETLAIKRIVREITATITNERPITIKTLEKEHLLLSDLPGMSNYQGILTPLKGAPDGAVHLVFTPRPVEEKNTFIGFDNFGSRYLGPYQLSGSWQGSLIPLQKTFLSATSSIPTNELSAINFSQVIPLFQDLRLELNAGYTRAKPGYTLKPREIESKAINGGISLTYQAIRQRQENLSFKAGLDARNSESTIIGTELTKDKIRALRLSGSYDTTDSWYGYNVVNVTLSRGLSALGASEADDLNLSRDGAKPNFTKAEIQYSRLQGINNDLSLLISMSAQKSSGSLFSSEEFGFGGQSLGRAYDPSEISGDDGIAGGLELRYQTLPPWQEISFQPYAFFDIGKVWNENSGQERTLTASSTGLGMRFQHPNGLSGTLQLALPLTKPVDAPLYGSQDRNAQIGFQIGYSF